MIGRKQRQRHKELQLTRDRDARKPNDGREEETEARRIGMKAIRFFAPLSLLPFHFYRDAKNRNDERKGETEAQRIGMMEGKERQRRE